MILNWNLQRGEGRFKPSGSQVFKRGIRFNYLHIVNNVSVVFFFQLEAKKSVKACDESGSTLICSANNFFYKNLTSCLFKNYFFKNNPVCETK